MKELRDKVCEDLRDLTRFYRHHMIHAKTDYHKSVWSDLYKKSMKRRIKILKYCYQKEGVSL